MKEPRRRPIPSLLGSTVLLAAMSWSCTAQPGTAPAPVTTAAPRGHLLIVGGGPLPDEVLRRFVDLAGGPGRAHIVVFPMASSDPTAGSEITEDFRKLGAEARRVVLSRTEAEKSSPDLLAGVTGIWFGGGDQVKLTEALGKTPVEAAIHARYG